MPPVYRGHFGKPQAERLLWRAGFGPRPGEAERLAKLGLEGAVHALMRPGRDRLKGPRPHDDRGRKPRPTTAGATTSSGGSTGWSARPPAGRADDARLARLVRHLARRRRLGAADAAPEPALPARRPRLLPGAADGGHARPGDAALALRHRQREGLAERELRARADGAVHARRRPRRLHRARRARAGARADRLALRLEQQPRPGPTSASTRSATTPATRPSSASAATSTGATRAGSASTTGCTRRSSSTKLWSYFVPVPPRAATQRSLERLYVKQRLRDRPGRRGDPAPPRALRRAADGQVAGASTSPGCCAALGRGIDTEAWTWLLEPRRPAALLPAERRGLGRHALARHGHLPRALGDRGLRDAAEASSKERRQARPATRPTSSSHRARAVLGEPDADRRRPTPR